MLRVFKTMADKYQRYMTNLGRMRAREVLLNSSDRMLEDAGLSRELLEQGISTWPWKAETATPRSQSIACKTQLTRNAVRELQAYTDSELHDLGITRGTIEEAVQHGRPGIDRQDDRKAA